MNVLITIARILVGVLFIFSGLVKANDPLGLSYKMQEFFELWHMGGLNDLTLSMSVIMIAVEIIAGFALLIGWQMRFFSWLLLLLIIFFTFLTGYADLSGKFKNCGCFGDCFPISARTSFIKDIILLLLIAFLFTNRIRIRPLFSNRVSVVLMSLVTLFSFGIQWYVLKHLPFFDCLPYKKENNISEKMKIPPGSVPDSFAIRFVYEKGGKLHEFDMMELPADIETYTFKDRKQSLVKKGNAVPAITGFSVSGESGVDSTQHILDLPFVVLLFLENPDANLKKWDAEFGLMYTLIRSKNIPVFIITTSIEPVRAAIQNTAFTDIPILKCDFTAIRTAARANPTIYVLEKGTVKGKWSYVDIDEAEQFIRSLKNQPVVPRSHPVPDSASSQPVIN